MPPLPANGVHGRVVSLHLHPTEAGKPLVIVDSIEVVAHKGILGEPRYFGRVNHTTGAPSLRQISLIEREQIAGHAATLGLEKISPGAVRSNIETVGVNLISLIGQRVKVGGAVLFFHQARTPCAKMDAICVGLRSLMENNNQGVIAEVVGSGRIRVDDLILPSGSTPVE